jgi:hypothetical protein
MDNDTITGDELLHRLSAAFGALAWAAVASGWSLESSRTSWRGGQGRAYGRAPGFRMSASYLDDPVALRGCRPAQKSYSGKDFDER